MSVLFKNVSIALATFVFAGCLPARKVSSVYSTTVDANALFRGVGGPTEWGGQIFLPSRESRSANTVFLKVASAPDSAKHMIGKFVRLSWPKGSASATSYTPNIVFNSEELASAQKAGNVVPTVLSGWDNVGPLESLAAARCTGLKFISVPVGGGTANACDYSRIDRIFVKVAESSFDANTSTLRIAEDPTVVAGTNYTLVKDIRKTNRTWDNGKVAVYQANVYQKGTFDGITAVEFGVEESFGKRPNFTFNEINRSPAGAAGWYIYADTEVLEGASRHIVRAIQPRALLKINGEYGKIQGTAAGSQFLKYQDGIPPQNPYLLQNAITRPAFARLENNFRKVRIFPGGGQPLSEANPIQKIVHENSQRTFRVGETGLVVHLFHWITDPAGKKDVGPLGMVTGHYSYGFYTVMREPITNELQFDVVYHQVYGQGPDAVISSKVSRAEYMGNFRRGWSNSIATSDVLVRAPWLDNSLDDSGNNPNGGVIPMKIFDDTLSLMLHAYRTGSGDGISSVTPWASCVQDSSQALFIAMKRVEKELIARRGAAYCSIPEFGRVCGLANRLQQVFDSSEIFNNALVRGDWINNAINMDIRRTTGRVESGLVTLQSYKTALPRNAFNLFLSSMLESGSNLVLMDNVQIGGFWTPEQKQHTFNPTPATTIVDVVKHMMAQGQQIPPNLTNEQFIQFVLEKEGVKSLEELAQKYSQK